MDDFFLALLLLSIAGLIAGLVRPQWFRLSSRKMAGGAFGGAAVLFFILFGITTPSEPEPSVAANTAPTAQRVADTPNTPVTSDTGANSASQGQNTAPFSPPTQQPAPKPAPVAASETVGQKNAIRRAIGYLGYTAFSREGLIAQLEYEQFSHTDAVYGVDNSGANWDEQAAKKAKGYMEYSAFSRGSLIAQLKYDKFTQAQAEYGADAVGL